VSPDLVNAGNIVCPVMGAPVDENAKHTYTHEGKIYNLCCPSCAGALKDDPQRYLGKLAQEEEDK